MRFLLRLRASVALLFIIGQLFYANVISASDMSMYDPLVNSGKWALVGSGRNATGIVMASIVDSSEKILEKHKALITLGFNRDISDHAYLVIEKPVFDKNVSKIHLVGIHVGRNKANDDVCCGNNPEKVIVEEDRKILLEKFYGKYIPETESHEKPTYTKLRSFPVDLAKAETIINQAKKDADLGGKFKFSKLAWFGHHNCCTYAYSLLCLSEIGFKEGDFSGLIRDGNSLKILINSKNIPDSYEPFTAEQIQKDVHSNLHRSRNSKKL